MFGFLKVITKNSSKLLKLTEEWTRALSQHIYMKSHKFEYPVSLKLIKHIHEQGGEISMIISTTENIKDYVKPIQEIRKIHHLQQGESMKKEGPRRLTLHGMTMTHPMVQKRRSTF